MLGAPYDMAFQPLGQRPLFKNARTPIHQPLNEIRHEYRLIESNEELQANAAAWSLGSVGGGWDASTRWAIYRAYQLVDVAEFDDSTRMRRPPFGAAYYPWRVYVGHAYEEVISGRSRDFTLSAALGLGVIGGSFDSLLAGKNLTSNSFGRGLVPRNGQASFAKTPEAIQGGYATDGPPVPIIVEYRQIPGTTADPSRIEWEAPLQVVVRFNTLRVLKDGSWGPTPWTMSAYCKVRDRDVPVDDSTVWNGKVNARGSYPLQWSAALEALPGDTLSCGTSGWLRDSFTERTSVGVGGMTPPLVVQPGLRRGGRFAGRTAKASYTVDWSVEVSTDASVR